MTWDEENDYIINNTFEELIGKTHKKRQFLSLLELYLTSDCNQKCEYCYLVKYGDNLYPKEFRDFSKILNNLELFLNYLLEQNYEVPLMTIFSGEIWHTKNGIKVLDILLNYIKKAEVPPTFIMIPSNFTFILNDSYVEIIKYYVQEYKKAGTKLHFSCSIDGKFIEQENRSFVNTKNNILKNSDEYYDKLFNFLKEESFGMHPMVNAYSIEKWKDQYIWWIDNIIKYDFTLEDIMFLEVRNDEWTTDKIFSYLDFLNTVCNYTLSKYYNNNFKEFIISALGINNNYRSENYTNFRLSKNSSMMQCTVDRMLCIRVGDLSWVPCHRTSYEPFIYGTFQIENNKITKLKANNIPLLISVYSLGYKGHPKCDACPIGDICMRGCYGAQFESTGELFYPCHTVCDLWIAKALFLYYKYEEMIKQYNFNNQTINSKMQWLYSNYIIKIPEEERNKWIVKIKQLIVN